MKAASNNDRFRSSFSREKMWLRQGVILSSLFITPLLLPAQALAASASVSGDIISQHIDTDYVSVRTDVGSSSLTLDNFTTSSVELAPATGISGSFSQTLTLSGSTTLNKPGYSGVIMQTNAANRDATVIVGSGVSITSGGGFGGIWVRNDTSGNVLINSAATINATGPTVTGGNDGINGVTNLGGAVLINSGTVTTTNRGLYAEGNGGSAPVVVSITNSGNVTAVLAGARSINYVGLASINNSGTVLSTTRQALVAWSNDGPVEIINSGTATAQDRSAIVAASETGDVTVTNSGLVTASLTNISGNGGVGYAGIQAYADTTGAITVTNETGGEIHAAYDAGIVALTPQGNVTVTNRGLITGLYGIEVASGDGSVATTAAIGAFTNATSPTVKGTITVANSGIITTQDLGVYLDGTSNILNNSGTITTAGTLAIKTGTGNSTITNSGSISATGTSAVAIAMGSGTNRLILTESSDITGRVTNTGTASTLELTGSGTGIFTSSAGGAAQYQGFSAIDKTGSGVWTLAGGSYDSNVTVNTGTLRIGSAAISIAGAVTNNALLDLQSNVLTVGGSLTGNGTIGLTIGSSNHGYLINSNVASNLSQMSFAIDASSTLKRNQTLVLVRDYAGQAPTGVTVASGYRLYRLIQTAGGGIDSQADAYGAGSLLLTNVPLSTTRGYTPVPTNNAALVIQNYEGSNASLGNLSLAVQGLSTASDINKAGAQLRPEANGGTQAAALAPVSQVLQTITLRNDTIRAGCGLAPVGDGPDRYPRGLNLWGQSFYTNADQGVRDGVDGYILNTAGFAFGGDALASDSTRVGASFAYAGSDLNDRATRAGSGEDVNSYIGTLYASYDGSPWYVDGALVGGLHQYDSTRLVDIGGIREYAKGSFNAQQYGAKVEGGYPVALQRVIVTPLASLAFNHLSFDSYTEHGGHGADLRVSGDDLYSLRSGLGSKLATTLTTKSGWLIQPDVHAFWFHEFGDTALNQTSQYAAAGGGSFTTPGLKLAADGLGLGASLSMVAPKGVNVSLKYDAEFQEAYVSHSVVFEARVQF